MQIQINLISATSAQVPGKKYKQIEVAYKNDKGEIKGKKFADFGVKSGLDVLLGAKAGDTLNVEILKEGEYWNWKEISKGDGSAPASPLAPKAGGYSSVPSRDFESKTERAARQVLIVRQSCLSTAVAALATGKASVDIDAVLSVARIFEDFVFEERNKDEAPKAAESDHIIN